MDRLLEYISHHPWLVGATAIVAAIVIAWELRTRSGEFAAISPQEAIRLMNQNALVLDIRKADEFQAGHLTGARHLSSDQILTASETMKKYKEKPVLVYCGNGSLGASAARQLAAQGFTKAVNLRGGIAGWLAENLPLVKGASK